MRRRELIRLLGGAIAASPLAAHAQQPMLVIGFLYLGFPEVSSSLVAAFRKGLNEAGFIEGRNVAVEYRFAYQDPARLLELAADLVRRRVAVIATPGIAAALAAKAATTTIPIVFQGAVDPVRIGLVTSLNRPGGNITGVVSMNLELAAKRLGLLRELLPRAARFAVLVNPNTPVTQLLIADARTAASTMGLDIEVLTASTSHEIDTAFETFVQKRLEAFLISPQTLFDDHRSKLATLALRNAVPAIYAGRDWVEAGGLLSYGTNYLDQVRQIGTYTGRILKGEKPVDLPVLQPTRFEFVLNLKTAKTLGLDISPALRALADEVIE
jgi:putative ABC transport system substrate-binding protein